MQRVVRQTNSPRSTTLVLGCVSMVLVYLNLLLVDDNYQFLPSKSCSSIPKPRIHVAVVFYGLTRSLRFTYRSINRNIYSPLSDDNIQFTTFLHHITFNTSYSNPRSGEVDIVLDDLEWGLLPSHVVSSSNHSNLVVENSALFSRVLSFGDVHNNNGSSTSNAVEALSSMRRAVLAATSHGTAFAGMVLLRPDLMYHDPIDIDLLRKAKSSGFIVTPGWQMHLGGYNDRFSFGAWSPMTSIGMRFDHILLYCNTTGRALHSETFMRWMIDEHLKSGGGSEPYLHIKETCHTRQTASRVWGDGRIELEDFALDDTFVEC